MIYTIQEKKNHRNFALSFLIQFLLLALIGFSVKNQIVILSMLGFGLIVLNSMWLFYIGYSHGWELKRISIDKQ